MKIWTKLTEGELGEIAEELGIRLYNYRTEGRAHAFVLRPLGDRYRRFSPRGRKVWAVCWHGHRDFFKALFERDPDARVRSQMATYNGREDFLAKHEATEWTNVGSLLYPAYYGELCECE